MNTEKTTKTEEILDSLDGVKRASAPDFFFTRLKARLEKGDSPAPFSARSWVLRPAYAFAVLVLVLLVNAAVIFTRDNPTSDIASNTDGESVQTLASEYRINDVNSLYDLNQEK